jgi:hypothetical protein
MATNNKSAIKDKECVCFYCFEVFKGDTVVDFLDNGKTARCPHCGVDSVLPNVIDKDTLTKFNKYSFERG